MIVGFPQAHYLPGLWLSGTLAMSGIGFILLDESYIQSKVVYSHNIHDTIALIYLVGKPLL